MRPFVLSVREANVSKGERQFSKPHTLKTPYPAFLRDRPPDLPAASFSACFFSR